jgi:hypothetical protein
LREEITKINKETTDQKKNIEDSYKERIKNIDEEKRRKEEEIKRL